jgi:hypothetical protein
MYDPRSGPVFSGALLRRGTHPFLRIPSRFLSSGILALTLLLLSGCLEGGTAPDPDGLSGQWCTEGTIGSGGVPVAELPYLGMVLGQQGTEVEGSGAVKRAESTELWPVRYRGTLVGDALTLQVENFTQGETDAPSFTLELSVTSPTSLEGVAQGDPGFPGTLTVVRMGERCFTD